MWDGVVRAQAGESLVRQLDAQMRADSRSTTALEASRVSGKSLTDFDGVNVFQVGSQHLNSSSSELVLHKQSLRPPAEPVEVVLEDVDGNRSVAIPYDGDSSSSIGIDHFDGSVFRICPVNSVSFAFVDCQTRRAKDQILDEDFSMTSVHLSALDLGVESSVGVADLAHSWESNDGGWRFQMTGDDLLDVSSIGQRDQDTSEVGGSPWLAHPLLPRDIVDVVVDCCDEQVSS